MTPGGTRCGQRFCRGPSPSSSELAHSSGTQWPSSPRCQPLSKESPQVRKQRAPSAPVESRDVDPRGHLDPPLRAGGERFLVQYHAYLTRRSAHPAQPVRLRSPLRRANPRAAHVFGFQLLGHALQRAAWPIGALARRRGRSRSGPEFLRNVSG